VACIDESGAEPIANLTVWIRSPLMIEGRLELRGSIEEAMGTDDAVAVEGAKEDPARRQIVRRFPVQPSQIETCDECDCNRRR